VNSTENADWCDYGAQNACKTIVVATATKRDAAAMILVDAATLTVEAATQGVAATTPVDAASTRRVAAATVVDAAATTNDAATNIADAAATRSDAVETEGDAVPELMDVPLLLQKLVGATPKWFRPCRELTAGRCWMSPFRFLYAAFVSDKNHLPARRGRDA
jgi:hypothetical protein